MKLLLCLALLTFGSLKSPGADAPAPVEPINVDFVDEYRGAILRIVADLAGLNIVIPSALPQDKLALKLKNATWEEIFELCLDGSGYTYVKTSTNIVRIVPLANTVKVVEVLQAKLGAEMDQNRDWRALLINLVETGALDCEPTRKEALVAFILRVDHTPEQCLAQIVQSRSTPTSSSRTPHGS